eukprot:7876779-Lingulodinium_polyedra.AAC.1
MYNRARRSHAAQREAAAIVRDVRATARESMGFAPAGGAASSGQAAATAAVAPSAAGPSSGAPSSSSGQPRAAPRGAG